MSGWLPDPDGPRHGWDRIYHGDTTAAGAEGCAPADGTQLGTRQVPPARGVPAGPRAHASSAAP